MEFDDHRYWFLTWSSYGTWLPGDRRGFVGETRDRRNAKQIHNLPGTDYDEDIPPLQRFAASQLKGPRVVLDLAQAEELLRQFQETAEVRRWLLVAVAVMATHAHLVNGVEGDPNPEDILRDYKSYGSRALNRRWDRPINGTWWTESGSKRKLVGEATVLAAVRYVREQEEPLVLWVNPRFVSRLDMHGT